MTMVSPDNIIKFYEGEGRGGELWRGRWLLADGRMVADGEDDHRFIGGVDGISSMQDAICRHRCISLHYGNGDLSIRLREETITFAQREILRELAKEYSIFIVDFYGEKCYLDGETFYTDEPELLRLIDPIAYQVEMAYQEREDE